MEPPVVIAIVGGEGTRMYPLTLSEPKPLLPICNYPTLMRLFEVLAVQGCREFIFASKGFENTIRLKESFKYGDGFTARLGLKSPAVFHYQPNYPDRGSADAVRYCAEYYDVKRDMLVVTGDAIMEVDVAALVAAHRKSGALMTVCLKEVADVATYGVADCAPDGRIRRFVEKPARDQAPSHLANMGVYVLSPRIREVFRSVEPGRVADFGKDLIPHLAERGEALHGYVHTRYWNDVGTAARFLETAKDILAQKIPSIRFKNRFADGVWVHSTTRPRFDPGRVELAPPVLVGGDTSIGPGVRIENSCVGDQCLVGEGSFIRGSVVMDHVNVGKHCRLVNCIVGKYATIEDYAVVDSEMSVDFHGGAEDRTPVVGEGVRIFARSVIGPKKRVARIQESHRILATGKFQDLGYDRENVYFIEK
jgi:NDP-sugar pyrophosphorylase family protein